MTHSDKFALVTGASTGIGFHLAEECAKHGYDLLIAADEPRTSTAAEELRAREVDVKAIKVDLAWTSFMVRPNVDRLIYFWRMPTVDSAAVFLTRTSPRRDL
jgi:short-subunit dehydrogenase